jgi:hypothetical protein
VVVTDVRTEDEMGAVLGVPKENCRIYWVRNNYGNDIRENGILEGSKILEDSLFRQDIRKIYNMKNGVFSFYRDLEHFFFTEDVKDIYEICSKNSNYPDLIITDYIKNFRVVQKGR